MKQDIYLVRPNVLLVKSCNVHKHNSHLACL